MKKLYCFLTFGLLLLSSCETDNVSDQNISPYVDFSNQAGGVYDMEIPGDNYNEIVENPFVKVEDQAISTFSIDADGASYANLRRFLLQDNQLPPKNAIRTEEMINYFNLDYGFTESGHPISLNGEISNTPWNNETKLIRIGIKGKPLAEPLPPSNFVFLIDVSGSMGSEDKLELLKNGFKTLVNEFTSEDRIAIVTYAGSSSVILESTPGNEKGEIINAIDRLGAGGSTAGSEGIKTAYEIAAANFLENGNNRVILGSDGDFNVGITSQEELIELIEEKRDSGIFLSVLGVGRGNLNDAAMEQIANNGNGTYEYIDNIEQLRKVFIYEYNKFFTVAKDVKVQVEFDIKNVEAYRLIGYENRLLKEEDFEDDEEDAGEIGAGQNITAIYEVIPSRNPQYSTIPSIKVDFRYKDPDSDSSQLLGLEIFDEGKAFGESSDFMRFTASIASFSMLLRDSEYKGSSEYDKVLNWLNSTSLADEHGFKAELKTLVEKAKNL
ncbi:VWA domain-containing protein [Salegentibacter sp. JZCK2]|uniref:vWA domain-containing protein n=1 Tax=Salegentibacter tibetensis TaxID=2873600 RepID=UPI001CC90C71|nr:VWA domain-containing protein [Salegentibacter tibetensis]MBZ9730112.1 VWA domain-containing protein [Salegentibacter tibetensis]